MEGDNSEVLLSGEYKSNESTCLEGSVWLLETFCDWLKCPDCKEMFGEEGFDSEVGLFLRGFINGFLGDVH